MAAESLSPLAELESLLNRLEERIQQSQEVYMASIRPPEEDPDKAANSGFLINTFRRLTTSPSPSSKASPVGTPDSSKHSLSKQESSSSSYNGSNQQSTHDDANNTHQRNRGDISQRNPKLANFINIPEQDSMVEDLRRIAELVVIGENYVTQQEKKAQKELEKSRQQWSTDRDMIFSGNDEHHNDDKGQEEALSPELADVFDLFFERNTLAILVELLNGKAYETPEIRSVQDKAAAYAEMRHAASSNSTKPATERPILLPPLAVATQAIQSLSILVQNVSRATSLYILFSNDYINEMINLQLNIYENAERNRRLAKGLDSASVFASAEVAELTTHFITFLKSLALRMNAETLQFFLQYPEEFDQTNGQLSTAHLVEGYDPGSLKVSFPLYDRALDFCAAHQDSFVRVTAMNICLNTIRLTTISDPEPPPAPKEENLEEEEGAFGSAIMTSAQKARSSSSPDVAIHRAQALPFRERLAIAQHTCTPSRVERLIAPIFTKLSERWTSLDEVIREMDAHETMFADTQSIGMIVSARTEKVAKVKEKVKREKLVTKFKDSAADLQDELLLLEDVFKVGLTVLNEQMIEMMMATFVYPLLLQPLVLFSQRYSSVVRNSPNQASNLLPTTFSHPFDPNFTGQFTDAQVQLAPVAGPAKTALFTMAAAFELLTNPPLLRLMFTALLHPISPDSTTVPTVRSKLQVASVDVYGRGTIRLDHPSESDIVPNSRASYPFGTNEINRRSSANDHAVNNGESDGDTEACVFVLAPALAEVLEFRGQDYDLIARTRPNGYRQALMECVGLAPSEFSPVRSLAICTLNAALSRLDPKLGSDLLFGVNLKTFADDMPADERNLDSSNAYRESDRGLGGGVGYESRHAISSRSSGTVGTNLVGQVINPVVSALLNTTRGSNKEWKLSYDPLAAHTLLCIAKGHVGGLISASKNLETRSMEASRFVARLSTYLHSPVGGSAVSYFFSGAPSPNAPDYDDVVYGAITNIIIHGVIAGEEDAPIEQFLRLQSKSSSNEPEGLTVAISTKGNFNEMTNRISFLFMADYDASSDALVQNTINRDLFELRESVTAYLKSDALLTLLKDLAATSGLALQTIEDLAGVALAKDGTFVQTMDWKFSKEIHSPISSRLTDALINSHSLASVNPGETLKLAGYPAIPCVCEAPASLAHLFASEGSGIVAQGVTWQSLYLVFRDGWMIFAQPIPSGKGGEGRVIGACLLERTYVDKDTAPVDSGSPARCLLFSYCSYDLNPPSLFLFDEMPAPDNTSTLAKVRSHVSHLDVWCENERSTEYAFQVASSQIFKAKAAFGQRTQTFLSPSSYRH